MKAPQVHRQGSPCWIDLATPTPQVAMDFYGALFAWEFVPPPEGSGYTMATVGGEPVAGIAASQNAEMTPIWTTYMATTDAATTVDAVRAAGGEILVGPMEVGPAGTMAYVRDSERAGFGLWQGAAHRGVGLVAEPGALSRCELWAQDIHIAAAFYNAALGLEAEPVDSATADSDLVLTLAGEPVATIASLPRDAGSAEWKVYFGSADLAITRTAAEAAGGCVLAHPTARSGQEVAQIRDPGGATFCVVEVA